MGPRNNRISDPIVVDGGGWSALVLTILLAERGIRVMNTRPFVDPMLLPRPFPTPAHPGWRSFLQSHFPDTGWRRFGGRVVEPFAERRVALGDASFRVAAVAGGFEIRDTDPVWSWCEPLVWSDWYRILERTCRDLAAVTIRYHHPYRLRQEVKRLGAARAVAVGADDWCLTRRIDPDAVVPLCGRESNASWWTDSGYSVRYLAGNVGACVTPDRRSEFEPRGYLTRTTTWGESVTRQVQILDIASPAQETGADWFTRLVAFADGM